MANQTGYLPLTPRPTNDEFASRKTTSIFSLYDKVHAWLDRLLDFAPPGPQAIYLDSSLIPLPSESFASYIDKSFGDEGNEFRGTRLLKNIKTDLTRINDNKEWAVQKEDDGYKDKVNGEQGGYEEGKRGVVKMVKEMAMKAHYQVMGAAMERGYDDGLIWVSNALWELGMKAKKMEMGQEGW